MRFVVEVNGAVIDPALMQASGSSVSFLFDLAEGEKVVVHRLSDAGVPLRFDAYVVERVEARKPLLWSSRIGRDYTAEEQKVLDGNPLFRV